jgi:hypothetical protein
MFFKSKGESQRMAGEEQYESDIKLYGMYIKYIYIIISDASHPGYEISI